MGQLPHEGQTMSQSVDIRSLMASSCSIGRDFAAKIARVSRVPESWRSSPRDLHTLSDVYCRKRGTKELVGEAVAHNSTRDRIGSTFGRTVRHSEAGTVN